jgi:hypothetical protein
MLSCGKDAVPLPSLSRLLVSYRITVDLVLFAEAERYIEASRFIIIDSLVSRHEKGAVRLDLAEFEYEIEKGKLEFRAMKND